MKLDLIKNQIAEKLKGKNFKTLCVNFLSLLTLQGLNVILPFLTIPYLISTVGLELFGLITFSYSFAFFFQIIVEYGFNTISAREVSIHSDNKVRINEIFSDVISTKVLLLLGLSIVYIIIIFSAPKFSQHWLVYMIQYGCVIGQALFPQWLFHGLQKMKYITYINVIFKSLFTIAIFVFVQSPEDFWIAPLCTALGLISSAIASLIIVFRTFKISYVKTSIQKIKHQLKTSFYVFLSEIQIAAIANGNILILGFFAGNEAVGIFTAAEKIVRAIGNLQAPLINTLFPFISKKMQEDRQDAIAIIGKLRLYFSSALILLVIFLLVFSEYIFEIIYGPGYENSILVFKIILVFPLLSFIDQLYGKLVLLTNNDEKNFMKIFLFSSILSVSLSTLLSYFYSYTGLAISILFVQIFIAAGMYYYARKIIKSS